jgi:hypothetical protein
MRMIAKEASFDFEGKPLKVPTLLLQRLGLYFSINELMNKKIKFLEKRTIHFESLVLKQHEQEKISLIGIQ